MLWTLLAVALMLPVLGLETFWPKALALITFPWAGNSWTDGPHMVALFRMEHGAAAYAAPRDLNSLDDGPAYLFALFALRHALALPFAVVSYRIVSTLLGLLTVVPVCASAVMLGRSAGAGRLRSIQTCCVAAAAVFFALADLLRAPALQGLDSDALLVLTIAAALATYYALATRTAGPRAVWLLAGFCIVAAFTKQNSFALFPILAAGLLLAQVISWRLALGSALAFGALVALGIAVMPADMRAWTVQIPFSHPYEFTVTGRFGGFLTALAGQYFQAAQAIGAGIAILLLVRRNGRGAWFEHGGAALAVLAASAASFFAPFGGQRELTLVGIFCAPYCGALAGLVASPRFVKRAHWGLAAGAVVILLLVARGLSDAPDIAAPDPEVAADMTAAGNAVRDLCARDTVTATVLPDMLFGCPNARYALLPSYFELSAARAGFDPGLTVFDRPGAAAHVIDLASWPMPAQWRQNYHLDREFSVQIAYGSGYVPDELRIWSR